MTHIDIVLLYRNATFFITDGPYKGKYTQLRGLYFDWKMAVSKTDKEFPVELLMPVLTPIGKINEFQARSIINLYFGKDYNHNGSFDPIEDVKGIFSGRHFVAGDKKELEDILTFCIHQEIDYFGAIEKGFAVEKK